MAEASSTSSTLCADIMAELKQTMETANKAAAKSEKVAQDVFQLYTNRLSIKAR
jgi:hypothetical protein